MSEPMKHSLSPFLPGSLGLGMIGNCAISALIDAQARMVWCCLPRFDGDPVFNALLEPGENGSHFAIEVEDLASTEQWYEPNTAILRTRLLDKAGQGVELTDFAPRFFSRSRYFRPMTLVRRVRPIQGSPRIRVVLKPRFDWGQSAPRVTHGSNHIRYVGEPMTLRVSTDAPIAHVLSGQPYVLTRDQNFILGADETLDHGIADTARMFEQETQDYWRVWSQRLAVPLEWQDAVIRAAITLKLSVFEDTGAIVAAMTTSIPESAHSGRNWDYRYCWLRDAFFVVRALNSLSEVGPFMALAWSAICPKPPSPHSRATAAWGRCAWATRRPNTFSTTCTETSSWARRRPFTTTGFCTAQGFPNSRGWNLWASRRCASMASPMPACGSCARAPACTPRRR